MKCRGWYDSRFDGWAALSSRLTKLFANVSMYQKKKQNLRTYSSCTDLKKMAPNFLHLLTEKTITCKFIHTYNKLTRMGKKKKEKCSHFNINSLQSFCRLMQCYKKKKKDVSNNRLAVVSEFKKVQRKSSRQCHVISFGFADTAEVIVLKYIRWCGVRVWLWLRSDTLMMGIEFSNTSVKQLLFWSPLNIYRLMDCYKTSRQFFFPPLFCCSLMTSCLICISPVCLQSRLWRSHAESGPWGTVGGLSAARLALSHSAKAPSEEARRPPGSPLTSVRFVGWSRTVTPLVMISWGFPLTGTGRSARCSPFPEAHVKRGRESPWRQWRRRGGRRRSGTARRSFVPARPFCRTDT